jgi:hypothetical protein
VRATSAPARRIPASSSAVLIDIAPTVPLAAQHGHRSVPEGSRDPGALQEFRILAGAASAARDAA